MNEFFLNAKKNKPEWREEQMEVIKKVGGLSLGWVQVESDSGSQLLSVPGLLQGFGGCGREGPVGQPDLRPGELLQHATHMFDTPQVELGGTSEPCSQI